MSQHCMQSAALKQALHSNLAVACSMKQPVEVGILSWLRSDVLGCCRVRQT